MKVSNQQRARIRLQRLSALRKGATFAPALARARKKELERVLSLAGNYKVEDWEEKLPELLNEKYLKKWYGELVLGVGEPVARQTINDFLNRKADMWTDALNKWIKKNGGRKVKIIQDGFKDWFKGAIKEAISDQRESIEVMTKLLFDNVTNFYSGVQEWQIRRIIQTESLTALSVAQNESVKELGIKYQKTWVISGNNTRPAHAAMDGVTIKEDELFNVDEEEMEYPRDDTHGASAGNIINCACSVIYSPI